MLKRTADPFTCGEFVRFLRHKKVLHSPPSACMCGVAMQPQLHHQHHRSSSRKIFMRCIIILRSDDTLAIGYPLNEVKMILPSALLILVLLMRFLAKINVPRITKRQI